MTRPPDEVRQLIGEGWKLPGGAAQIAVAEEAVRHADALGDRRLGFAARLLATAAYHRGGQPGRSFAPFARCLADYDADPGAHGGTDERLLRWFFKDVVAALPRFPEIPLARVHAALEDMERRYRAGGHSLHAVYRLRWLLARHVGDEPAVDEWYARWCAAPRDENSDCAGCDPTDKVRHLTRRGRDAEAVALAAPVLAGRIACVEQPHALLTGLLLPYLRTGRAADAGEAHRRAYRGRRGSVTHMVDVAVHVAFCARTGNEERGVEIVQRHLGWLDRAPSPYAAMEFAAAAALVLRRLARAGAGGADGRTLHRPAADGRPAADVGVAELGEELAGLATALAARFDARNGTGHQSARIAGRLAAAPLLTRLPLSPTTRRRTPPAGADAPAGGAAAGPAGAGPTGTGAVPEVPAAAGADELLDLAERYGRADRAAAARAVLRAFDARFGDAPPTPLAAARRDDARGSELADRRDAAGAERAWRRAVDGYRAAGDELRAQVVLGRLGVLRCLTDRADDGLPMVERSRAYVLDHGPADRRAAAHSRTGIALLALGRGVEALAAFDAAAAAAATVDDPHLAADVALRRAHCLAGLDRPAELRAAAARARDLHRPLGGEGLALACLLYGSAVGAQRPGEALAAFDEAVRAAPAGRAELDPRLARARQLCALDRPAEAVDDLVEVVALCAELGIADGAAFTRFELAGAYRQADRPLDAAEAGEEAVAALAALGAQEAADRCRYLLSLVYRELGEEDAALDLLDQLAANLDGFDNAAARAGIREEAGDLLYRRDRDAAAAVRFAAAAADFDRAGRPLDALRALRRRALALRWAGVPAAALDALAAADAAADRLPAEVAAQPAAVWERAVLGHDGTTILVGAERYAEALARITPVPGQLRGIEAFGEACRAELLLGEVLLRLDRAGAAEPVLRGVLDGLPRDADALPQAAWLLAEALERLDRAGEARLLRDAYRLDAEGG